MTISAEGFNPRQIRDEVNRLKKGDSDEFQVKINDKTYKCVAGQVLHTVGDSLFNDIIYIRSGAIIGTSMAILSKDKQVRVKVQSPTALAHETSFEVEKGVKTPL